MEILLFAIFLGKTTKDNGVNYLGMKFNHWLYRILEVHRFFNFVLTNKSNFYLK